MNFESFLNSNSTFLKVLAEDENLDQAHPQASSKDVIKTDDYKRVSVISFQFWYDLIVKGKNSHWYRTRYPKKSEISNHDSTSGDRKAEDVKPGTNQEESSISDIKRPLLKTASKEDVLEEQYRIID